jgi:hypothetical protein
MKHQVLMITIKVVYEIRQNSQICISVPPLSPSTICLGNSEHSRWAYSTLAYGQMTENLTSQAAVMQLNGVPNDIIQNLNPISIIIIIIIFFPIMGFVLNPVLRKARI